MLLLVFSLFNLTTILLDALARVLLVIDNVQDFVAEVSVLQLAIQDPLLAHVLLRGDDCSIQFFLLNLIELRFVLAYIGWIRLASVALDPSFATRRTEARRLGLG